MRILIVGAGLSGCSLARLLKDRGHTVSLIEKESRVGGLCITAWPFGAWVNVRRIGHRIAANEIDNYIARKHCGEK